MVKHRLFSYQQMIVNYEIKHISDWQILRNWQMLSQEQFIQSMSCQRRIFIRQLFLLSQHLCNVPNLCASHWNITPGENWFTCKGAHTPTAGGSWRWVMRVNSQTWRQNFAFGSSHFDCGRKRENEGDVEELLSFPVLLLYLITVSHSLLLCCSHLPFLFFTFSLSSAFWLFLSDLCIFVSDSSTHLLHFRLHMLYSRLL